MHGTCSNPQLDQSCLSDRKSTCTWCMAQLIINVSIHRCKGIHPCFTWTHTCSVYKKYRWVKHLWYSCHVPLSSGELVAQCNMFSLMLILVAYFGCWVVAVVLNCQITICNNCIKWQKSGCQNKLIIIPKLYQLHSVLSAKISYFSVFITAAQAQSGLW